LTYLFCDDIVLFMVDLPVLWWHCTIYGWLTCDNLWCIFQTYV